MTLLTLHRLDMINLSVHRENISLTHLLSRKYKTQSVIHKENSENINYLPKIIDNLIKECKFTYRILTNHK